MNLELLYNYLKADNYQEKREKFGIISLGLECFDY